MSMKIKPFEWKQSASKYSSGKDCFVGKIKVGLCYYNGIDRTDETMYIANCTLPQVKNNGDLGKFPNERFAMLEVERIVNIWFKEVLE